MYYIIFLFCIAASIAGIQMGMHFWRNQRAAKWFARGVHSLEQRDFQGAATAFRKVSSMAPQILQARVLLATALARSGNEEEAIEQMSLLEALHPNEAQVWAMVCTFYISNLPQYREKYLHAFARTKELDEAVAEDLRTHEGLKTFLSQETPADN